MSRSVPDPLGTQRRRPRRGGRQRATGWSVTAAAVASTLVLCCPGLAQAASGDLDTSFDTDGKVTTDFGGAFDRAAGVAVQPDGKIVTAGIGGSGGDFALTRYNTDGTLDTSFDTDGKVTTDFIGAFDQAFDLVLQADGKIVAAGGSGGDFTLARYNADGSLDTSFDTDGKVTTDVTGSVDQAFSVALQADGKIVAAGRGDSDFGLARYNADGSLDTSFDTDGKVTTDFTGSFDQAFSVAVQADGKIVAAGRGDSDFGLARYNADGSLDTSFDTDGKVTTDFTGGADQAFSVALQADGKIVAAGGRSGDFALARYNADGSLDTSFDTDGQLTTDFTDPNDLASAVVVQPDGRIVAAGQSDRDFALARYNANGSPDTSFDTDGQLITDFTGASDGAFAVALQSDGKIVAAGRSDTDFALARYQNGTVDVDLAVAKTGPATVRLGNRASYTVTVTNTSTTASATNVTLTDALTGPGRVRSATPSQGTCITTTSSATCTLGTLAPGSYATVTVVVKPTARGTLADTATVDATEADLTPANDTATATTTVTKAHCTPRDATSANNLVGTTSNDVTCPSIGQWQHPRSEPLTP
uniref:Calcium-binding protein n=1 Tax=Streptomyces sp. NBC_00049 TaxID=2903617 RepID=A0AAU2K1G8_9ACTN